jgi:hypothetical protein
MDEMPPGSGLISIYAPKFDLLNLGNKDERIVLRIIFRSPSLNATVFANYVVGRKEAQIAIRLLNGLRDIDVVSVTRYGIGEFARDVNRYFRESRAMEFEMAIKGNTLKLRIGDKEIPAAAEEMYASSGEAYLVIECANKKFRIATGRDGTKMYDLQRRRIVGIGSRDGEIVFQRAFQHLGLAE